jgi:protein-S-isoprenylcysteine O-methyltransferase Ste14
VGISASFFRRRSNPHPRRYIDHRRSARTCGFICTLEGLGTPAPIAPTQKLVVTGLYRYVRNPIYIAVVAVIFGQALLFGDWRLLWYGALLWLFFHVWVVMIEEPTLKQTFGTEYESFRTNVPRWIPRLTPWRAA